jgi:hypothetical protein
LETVDAIGRQLEQIEVAVAQFAPNQASPEAIQRSRNS